MSKRNEAKTLATLICRTLSLSVVLPHAILILSDREIKPKISCYFLFLVDVLLIAQ
jgi:hypothetical protein